MRHLFRPITTLRSTGQQVHDLDAATPRGLRKVQQGYTAILINHPKGNSVQVVRNSKLQRTTAPATRAFNRTRAHA